MGAPASRSGSREPGLASRPGPSGFDPSRKLLPCPFCGGPAEIREWRYEGAHSSGMETPHPYAACKNGCVKMVPVSCDDWPYGRKNGRLTSKQARNVAIEQWNTRS